MRVSTALNRMLCLPGASVQDVAFGGEGVIVTVRLRRRRRVCSGCGAEGLEIKDRRVGRWRHLDLGASRGVIECELRRLRCPGCGDRPEMVPWARAGSSSTRDFEDVVAFLAQQMAKTPLSRLIRIGWRSVGKILARVVADKLDRGRLDGLVMIGVDEVSPGADHRFLTCVADHDSGGVVWAAPGRNAQTLQAFFAELSDEQKTSITAVSIDMSAGYEQATRAPDGLPNAQVCFDPFHVCQLGSRAADQVRRAEYNSHGRCSTGEGKWIKGTRYSLLKDTANQTPKQLAKTAEVVLTNKRMYRAFLLLGELRYIYRLPKQEAAERLDAWLAGRPDRSSGRSSTRAHDPQAQSRGARRDPARDQQRTPRSLEQPRQADQPPRPRIPLSRRPDRDGLPLLTDTVVGDDGAIEDGDVGCERPNDQRGAGGVGNGLR